ncbi:GNAT family N-acetyltransferase [Candidatus Woesearchaeota archaeon]|nr:GNAT family N-acetyltransferase [Candidatus Woesearchaeota archaeon]
METLKIRQATMEDFDGLLKLKLESREEATKFNKKLVSIETVKDRYELYLKKDLSSEWRAVFIAVDDGKIVGMVLSKIFRSMYIQGHERTGYISNLYVKKEFRKKGIGKKLTRAVIDWLKSKDTTALTLEVYEANKLALDFYHQLGFKNHSVKMVRDI